MGGDLCGSVDEIVHALGEFDVEIGDTAGIVRGETQGDFGVLDGDVWVMLGLLGYFGEVVDEINRFHEFFELNGAGDGIFFVIPFRTFFQCGREIIIIKEVGHEVVGEKVRPKIAASHR